MNRELRKPSLAFVGLGYVGLSTAVCFASRGFRVKGIEIDERKLELLQKGSVPFHEMGMEPLLRASLKEKTLELSRSYNQLGESEIIFITVGTPSRRDGSIDTSYATKAAKSIGKQLATSEGYHLVVVKSTVIPGTTQGPILTSIEKQSGMRAGREFGLAMNPEFLHEGAAIEETLHPDALVIGGYDKKSSEVLLRMYRSYYGRLPATIVTSPSNAEMIKYAINAGRAVQLSFVNTVANLCSQVIGCDYDEVRKGLSVVARMDQRYLGAGLGFGGSCLPKDTRALAAFARSTGIEDKIISAALEVNEAQANEAVRIAESLGGPLQGKRVSILGLAFKKDTDDIRESVSISLARTLAKKGARVFAYDPVAMNNAQVVLSDIIGYAKTAKDCLTGSSCAFIATGWDEFMKLRPRDFKTLMVSPLVVDGRRIYNQAQFIAAGVSIATVGTSMRVPRSEIETR